MHNKSTHQNSTIRFRRWSRMGYAVFCSLACCVSIGALAVSVSDKTLHKSGVVSMSFVHPAIVCIATDDNATDEVAALLQQTNLITLSELNSDCAVACGLFILYTINCNG